MYLKILESNPRKSWIQKWSGTTDPTASLLFKLFVHYYTLYDSSAVVERVVLRKKCLSKGNFSSAERTKSKKRWTITCEVKKKRLAYLDKKTLKLMLEIVIHVTTSGHMRNGFFYRNIFFTKNAEYDLTLIWKYCYFLLAKFIT